MAGQHDVRSATRVGAQDPAGAVHQRPVPLLGRVREGMMRHHDARPPGLRSAQGRADAGDPAPVNAPALPIQRIDRVDAHDRELVVLQARLQLLPDPASVAVPRAEQAQRDVVERRVVVAGHDDAQRLDAVEESLRLLELPDPRALRQVAGHHDQVGRRAVYHRNWWVQQVRPSASEMQVGEVDDRAQEMGLHGIGRSSDPERAASEPEAARKRHGPEPAEVCVVLSRHS